MKRPSRSGPSPGSKAHALPGKAAARLLRAALTRVSFSGEALESLLGSADARLNPAEQEALWSFRARGETPLAVFARMFLFGELVPRAAAALVFGDDLARAEAAGLLRRGRAGLAATLSLSQHSGLPIFADGGPPGLTHVLGPTRATLVLEGALPPAAVRSALELGTGAGYLALRLAARARQVTATDVSSRALALAGLNATLADADNVRFLRSDRFAALGGQRFDLVVGNLPFVIAPERQYVYRDGGLPEDGFLASVISGVGAHLVPGGLALFLGQWVHKEDEPEDQRLAPWFVAAGCDALVLRLDAEPLDVYAARWSAGPRTDLSREARVRLLERWVLSLRRARIRGVSTGLFVLRRRRGTRHGMAIDDVDAGAPSPRWEEIAPRLAALSRG